MMNVRSYNGLFIITPDKKDALGDVKGSIASVIGENSGKIVKETEAGEKKLSHPINKKSEGVYYEVSFTAPSESISKMLKQFRINTNILRTLISVEGN
ncbi:MAG: 30S ribosomal protein S6 [Candidatus Omnitrophica bacterium]|nr:30S ribosomal protein S6 [Candidatus Omnitrophota bacterium]MDD4013482.1 30S ribosomal protein S6 [Candidatus Omnitrophota bacterium]